jgi:hypothetical protein
MREPKPYIELRDFPDLTPFSESAIQAHMSRGDLVEGKHFFHHGRRLVFKWDAIVEWIEKRAGELGVERGVGEAKLPADIVPIRRHG